MSLNKEKRRAVIKEILNHIPDKFASIDMREISKKTNISTQSIWRMLKELENQGKIVSRKNGKFNEYALKEELLTLRLPLKEISESDVFSLHVVPFIKDVPEVVFKNFAYAFTEILNNAIEHSEGSETVIFITRTDRMLNFIINDNGIGIFNKIAQALNLEDKKHSVLELAKGKFTSDPKGHTGEGIFFSSKVGDNFFIFSDGLIFSSKREDIGLENILFESHDANIGTSVHFCISMEHKETVSNVFDSFTRSPDDYGFSKTTIPVKMLEAGSEMKIFISRSQAKRLLSRVERFSSIVLDFEGVDEIGQGFADEIFRVFKNEHPEIEIFCIKCNNDVEKMIIRVENQL